MPGSPRTTGGADRGAPPLGGPSAMEGISEDGRGVVGGIPEAAAEGGNFEPF